MKNLFIYSITCSIFLVGFTYRSTAQKATKDKSEFYRITVYHFATKEQEQSLDWYLEKALLPALHKNKFENIGVFKPIANDTAADKKIYVYFPSKTMEILTGIEELVYRDSSFRLAAKPYLAAAFDKPPFTRYENILLKAFRLAKKMNLPHLTSAKAEHIYELRSYESATDGLYMNKVQMFNEGHEIDLFKKLNFNAVFYADVLIGSRMPNLIYMTSFENMTDRDEHWKAFGNSSEWKAMSTSSFYQHNVSKADIILMHAAPYSDF
jgi:hypothetical protein